MKPVVILGLDVAKDTFSVCLLRAAHRQAGEFANSPRGFRQLGAWLRQHQAPRVWACLEATGRYGEDLAEWLYAQDHTVSVVNPLAIKAYAQSQLARNKSDKLDAQLIARYCQSVQPAGWTPPAPEIKALRELVRQYDALQTARQQARNRLKAGGRSALVRAQWQAQVTLSERQIAELKAAIDQLIDDYPALKRRQALLESIPGFGRLTAAKIQAVDPQRFDDGHALAAYAGVTPMNRASGSSVRRRPRFSKIGAADLRRAIYMPAVVATRCNPPAQALYQRLCAKGLAKKAAIGAVMHQLLRQAFGVLKSGLPFDPNYGKLAPVTP